MEIKNLSLERFFYQEIFKNISKFNYGIKKINENLKDKEFLKCSKIEKKLCFKNQKEHSLLVGEIIKNVRLNKYIIKSDTGTKYIASSQVTKNSKNLKNFSRIGFDSVLFNIFKEISAGCDSILNTMVDLKKEFTHFSKVGGLSDQKNHIKEVMQFSVRNPAIFRSIGLKIPKGVLLFGPPGTGKTLLARSISSNIESVFIKMVGSGIVDRYIGESARIVREIFSYAKKNTPSIIFIDEIDAIGGRRLTDGNASDREVQRTLIELLNQLDGFEELKQVKILLATNRPDVLDPALVRPGRIDKRLKVALPNLIQRVDIFKIHLKGVIYDRELDFEKLMALCQGFNGSDLKIMAIEAAIFAARAKTYIVHECHIIRSYQKIRKAKI